MHTLTNTLLLSLPALFSACGSAPATMSYVDHVDGATSLRADPPQPYRLAIAPVELSAHATDALERGGCEIPFAFTQGELHNRFAAELTSLRTASWVVAVGQPGDGAVDLLRAAEQHRADLLIQPRVTNVEFAHDGANAQGVLSSILWLTTWIGGMFLADNDYRTRFEVEWEFVNPHDGKTVDVVKTESHNQQLSFAERNSALSWPTLQTLLVPPVWTSDRTASTSAALSGRAVASACVAFAEHVKTEMAGGERAVIGTLRLDSPSNGSTTESSSTFLRGRIIAAHQIQRVAVYVGNDRVWLRDPEQLPDRDAQEMGEWFQVPIVDLEVPLQPGDNEIRVLLQVGGYETTRTIRVHRSTETRS